MTVRQVNLKVVVLVSRIDFCRNFAFAKLTCPWVFMSNSSAFTRMRHGYSGVEELLKKFFWCSFSLLNKSLGNWTDWRWRWQGGGGNNSSSEKSKKAMATTWKENTYSAFLNFAINKRCKIPMSPAENNPINAKSTLPKQFIQKSDILGGTTSKVVKKNRKNRKNSCRW